ADRDSASNREAHCPAREGELIHHECVHPMTTLRNLVIGCAAIAWLAGPGLAADGVVRVAVSGRPPGLGNPFASMTTPGLHPWAYMFDALTRLEDDGTVGPGLATAWHLEGPTRWIFTLRPNVQFANGEPFDATAAAAVFMLLQAPELSSLYAAGEARSIAGVEVVDPLTLAITTTKPDAILDRRLSHIYMVPPAAWRERGADGFSAAPVGTGPYQLVDWATRTPEYELRRNSTSWRPSADVDRIVFKTLPDPTTRLQALLTGQADIAFALGIDSLDTLRSAGLSVIVRERSPVEGIALPNRDPTSPLADQRVRQAMNMAVNTQAIAATLLSGLTHPNGQGAIPEMFGYDPQIAPYAYDPDRARALLTEAGYDQGFALTLIARLEGKGAEWASIYQALVQDLGRVGIDVTLRTTPAQEWLRMWFSGDWGDADMTPFSWTSTYRDAGRAIETVSCAKDGAFFCVPDMMPRIEAAASEMDQVARRGLLQALLRDMHDLAPSIYLFPQIETLAHTDAIVSLPMSSGYYRLEQARLKANAISRPARTAD
ncbi:MAG: ABC transporter substrate-binding protein, partial [Rhodospirillaceae bacterium]|nr:ABC transporter substrate-binding protein [Rhodospirillaceae bacterium]